MFRGLILKTEDIAWGDQPGAAPAWGSPTGDWEASRLQGSSSLRHAHILPPWTSRDEWGPDRCQHWFSPRHAEEGPFGYYRRMESLSSEGYQRSERFVEDREERDRLVTGCLRPLLELVSELSI
jgi:hypothetical protein